MAKVDISESLLEEIEKNFKGESHEIIDLLETLEDNHKKGKFIVLYGINNLGKTTQAKLLVKNLKNSGVSVV